MAVSTWNAAIAHSSDATFRAWGRAISDAIAACGGVVKTADTGQINWTTVTRAGVNTSAGYEIYRFNDALQATAPVFVKLEYGTGSGVEAAMMWVTVGPATDGAGNLTGMVSTRIAINPAVISGGTANSRVSASSNRLQIASAYSLAGWLMLCNIERTHDYAGGDTAEGITIVVCAGTNYNTSGCNWTQQFYSFAGGAGQAEYSPGCLLPSVGTGSSGTAVAIYPIFLTKGTFLNPLMNMFLVFTANVTPGSQISLTYYGATRKYLPIGNANPPYVLRGTAFALSLVLRDE